MRSQVNGSRVHTVHTADAKAQREMGVVVACHELVCAIPVQHVVRLALPEDVFPTAVGLVKVGNDLYASWDLGERLGLAPINKALVLLRVPYRGQEIPIALRTGVCLAVQPLPERVELPRSTFTTRTGAIAGVFIVEARHGAAIYGLELDLAHLWDDLELDASALLVGRRKPR